MPELERSAKNTKMVNAGIAPWKIISGICSLFFGGCIIGSLYAGEIYVAPIFLIFFVPTFYLVLFFGRIRISEIDIRMSTPVGVFAINWSEVTAIEFAQSHIVLKGNAKRLVIPQFAFWSPKDRKAGISAFEDISRVLGITPRYRYSADFKIYQNTKIQ